MRIDTTATVDRSRNKYCGPLVLAAILGITTAEAAERIRRATGTGRAIKRVEIDELMTTLHANGYRMQPFAVRKERRTYRAFGIEHTKHVGPTFAAWLRSRSKMNVPHTYIVLVQKHVLLVKGRKMIDTFTDGEWRFISKAPHRRKRVSATWLIYKNQPAVPASQSGLMAHASGYHD